MSPSDTALHEAVWQLRQREGGLFGQESQFLPRHSVTPFYTSLVKMGNLGVLEGHDYPIYQPSGAGTAAEPADASFLAMMEGIERYCTGVFTKDQFLWASAEELGEAALDPDTIPWCSEAELAHPSCPLVKPDRRAVIRWVKAISLRDGREVFVPAVMVFLRAGYRAREERIWLPTTTGCAAAFSYYRALVSAILEVIERDAISLVWLQRLKLSEIETDVNSDELVLDYRTRLGGNAEGVSYRFFDATTDLGVPVIYGLQDAQADAELRTLVSCSADTNPNAAMCKVMRDMCAIRRAFAFPRASSWNPDVFTSVLDGAIFMAHPDRACAFSFLTQSQSRRRLSAIPNLDAARDNDEKERLKYLICRLTMNHMSAYAVDLSTDEAIRVGVRVVRVIIPELQPLSFHHRARFLGHTRLYQAPAAMGHPVRMEHEINPWPQPFA